MRIAVLKERAAGESRVAATPETVKKFIALGADSRGRARAPGESASIPDAEFEAAGAELGDAAATCARARTSCSACRGPSRAALAGAKPGAWVVAGLDPFGERAAGRWLCRGGLEALAMEFMPRITRAQSMDILSASRTSPATRR